MSIALSFVLERTCTSPVQLVTTIAESGVTCQDGDVKRFVFKCDSTSLDFIGTLQARKEQDPVETLLAPEDAAGWLQQSGIVDEVLDFTAHDFERALDLREAVWATVAAHLEGATFPADALAALNVAAGGPDPVPQLTQDGRRIAATPDQAMSAIARDAIAILTGPEADLLKECSRPGCNQVYVDRSRGQRREWCAMDPCGNRVKAREYRARKAAAA
jgi:predicted RNA-binding Zn ribbon-like protein